jgi:hypothetical protein
VEEVEESHWKRLGSILHFFSQSGEQVRQTQSIRVIQDAHLICNGLHYAMLDPLVANRLLSVASEDAERNCASRWTYASETSDWDSKGSGTLDVPKSPKVRDEAVYSLVTEYEILT